MAEIVDKQERAGAYSEKAEKALKILKIAVIVTAVCAVVLPAVSVILLITVDSAVYGLAGLILSLCVFAVMLAVLVCIFIYVRKQLKALKRLDSEEEIK